MNCSDCQEHLQARLDGAADRAGDLEAHLARCPECRRLYSAAGRLQAVLHQSASPVPPPELGQRIAVAVGRDQRHRRRLARGLYLAGAAALAASLVLVLLALPGGSGQPSHVEQAWAAVKDFFGPPSAIDGSANLRQIPLDPESDVTPEQGKRAAPSLGENMAEATSAVASLARRTADETVSNGQLLVPPVALPVPDQGVVTSPLDPPAESLRRTGRGVVAGLEPVTGSMVRAFDLFRRDIAPVAPEAKPGL
jgi:hypothetical protein